MNHLHPLQNLCIHSGHTGGKMRALPLGPKWQWHSGDFEGESKELVKKKLVDAGAEDTRHLFSTERQEKTIYVAMTLSTTDNPFYRPYTEIRRKFTSHLESDKLSSQEQGDFRLMIVNDAEQPMYLRSLAESTFVLSPPGKCLFDAVLLKVYNRGTLLLARRLYCFPVKSLKNVQDAAWTPTVHGKPSSLERFLL